MKRRKKGLEADECYWIQNESQMRGKKEFDLDVDPPPDLALEIDITHSSLDRMAIYAGLKILEVWRLEGNTLECTGCCKTASTNFVNEVLPFRLYHRRISCGSCTRVIRKTKRF